MANYSKIKRDKLMWSHITTTVEGDWDLEKQEDIEGCSEKSKEVREKDRWEIW